MPTRADLSAAEKSKGGHTPLMIAALEGDTLTVEHLLADRVNVNAKDDEGRTALMFAAANSHAEAVNAILRAGASINARARDGGTALMLAAANGDVEITRMLLRAGAKTDYKYISTGATAVSLAEARGHGVIVKMLENPLDWKMESKMSETTQAPVARAQMLIRKPVAEVFEAFVNPDITRHFWFSRSSGRLVAGKQLRWDWELYNVFTNVDAKAVEENKRILIEWNGPDNPSFVEWTFEPAAEDRTFVIVRNWGFRGDLDKIVAQAIDSTSGFSFLLAATKAFLEHGIELKLVEDHEPAAHVKGLAAH